MDTQTRPKTVVCGSRFPPHQIWIRMNADQLERSLYWLHEQIRLNLMRDIDDGVNLRLSKETIELGEFNGSLNVMWAHRRSGADDRLHIAVYEVCEVGNPGNVLVRGELEFTAAA
jgi:hypothetical protein